MNILNQLASSQGRNDQVLNIHLAQDIANNKDKDAVAELVLLLEHKNKTIQSDAIKTLYEIGEIVPELLIPYIQNFVQLLDSKNNRLVWGVMTTLKTITHLCTKEIFNLLDKLEKVSNLGSVITRDNYVSILITLGQNAIQKSEIVQRLCKQLENCPSNQLPMYAEHSLAIIDQSNKVAFIHILKNRIPEIDKESKKKRIEKILHKLNKL